MFPWLKEYEIFQEETFNRFLRNSGIINKNTIPQNHMVVQKIEQMLQLIDNKTSELSINQLQKQQIICLNKEKIPPKLLPAAFDNKYSRWSCRKPAIKFLQEQAPQLYNVAFEQLQKTKQELSHAIHQAKLYAALEKHELEINRLTQLANKYHIPILAEPYPVQPHSFCKIYGDARAEKYIQNAIKEGKYNIALAPTREGFMQLIYDEHPIQRPHNSNNSQPQCDITNDNKNTFTQNDQYNHDAFDTEER